MKPSIDKVVEIIQMRKAAQALFDESEQLAQALFDEFGAGRFDYKVQEDSSVFVEEKPYMKFELKDNVLSLMNGEPVWKSTAFKPLGISFDHLKREPASLKSKEA